MNLKDFCNKRWEVRQIEASQLRLGASARLPLCETSSPAATNLARGSRPTFWCGRSIILTILHLAQLQKYLPGQIGVIERFIEVANFCEKLGNYHAVAGILGGFSLWCDR